MTEPTNYLRAISTIETVLHQVERVSFRNPVPTDSDTMSSLQVQATAAVASALLALTEAVQALAAR